MNGISFTFSDQPLGVIKENIPLDPKFLDLSDQVFILRSQNLASRKKSRLVLLSIIRSVAIQQNDNPADLEQSIIKKLKGGFVHPSTNDKSRFKIPPGSIEQSV